MKNCKWFEKFFSDYIDGQLDSKMILDLESHLKDCPNCMEIIQRMKKIGKNLQNLPRLKTSNDFETVLRTRIRVEMGLKRNSWFTGVDGFSLKVPAYIVSLAVFAAMVFFISQQTSQNNLKGPVTPMSEIDSQLSNSKVIKRTRYELPHYIINPEVYSDELMQSSDNRFVIESTDSLQDVNELQQSPLTPYRNRIQQTSYSF